MTSASLMLRAMSTAGRLYDPSVTTKVLLISGATAFAIFCALATAWMALILFYIVLGFFLTD
jgi:hypothetical protein